ncbi:MAG: hypothetical protein BGO82_17160 [Devosia sp. 67-54]|jgi:hypothetical protein|uniref:hypothetical protein n=1 Tax=unclassified Devosia TaxID=196773 RepID=UPI000961B084|nr:MULTISPECIES: hypothetical protein [unclassified Devosia]MBN9304103.1 hypothetical protein [Devosia sp.]OJX17939.1 MAG: hypothetical protein BGO82_17160 [Devosia sp. 67-54]
MADMTLAEIDQALTDLRAAKQSRLVGGVRTKTAYVSGSVEKQFASLDEINGEIARLEVMRSRLTGTASGNGPIHVGFGRRY